MVDWKNLFLSETSLSTQNTLHEQDEAFGGDFGGGTPPGTAGFLQNQANIQNGSPITWLVSQALPLSMQDKRRVVHQKLELSPLLDGVGVGSGGGGEVEIPLGGWLDDTFISTAPFPDIFHNLLYPHPMVPEFSITLMSDSGRGKSDRPMSLGQAWTGVSGSTLRFDEWGTAFTVVRRDSTVGKVKTWFKSESSLTFTPKYDPTIGPLALEVCPYGLDLLFLMVRGCERWTLGSRMIIPQRQVVEKRTRLVGLQQREAQDVRGGGSDDELKPSLRVMVTVTARARESFLVKEGDRVGAEKWAPCTLNSVKHSRRPVKAKNETEREREKDAYLTACGYPPCNPNLLPLNLVFSISRGFGGQGMRLLYRWLCPKTSRAQRWTSGKRTLGEGRGRRLLANARQSPYSRLGKSVPRGNLSFDSKAN
ncbi:hypothetical protein BDN72DRAFT_864974 [Pluteus cervinus]|uniref:Uncharacterized protein n=1 Tax=Pluteus cervinus TaxID=181527 RepID=A0ACD3A270_9AGAR|nr:hypothetical protein BDN72DRAFT_864974 [Pluteus cervinus]